MIRLSVFSQFCCVRWDFSHKTLRGIAGVAVMALLFAGPVVETDVQAQSGGGSIQEPSGDVPSVKFSRRTFSVIEGSIVELTVLKEGAGAASVEYEFTNEGAQNNPATPNADYVDAPGRLDFADGETTKTIAVQTLTDGEVEESESFHVRLKLPDTARLDGSDGTLAIPYSAAVTILDCDSADMISC